MLCLEQLHPAWHPWDHGEMGWEHEGTWENSNTDKEAAVKGLRSSLCPQTQSFPLARQGTLCVTSDSQVFLKEETEQALPWKQDSILDQTVDFEQYAQYLWKWRRDWKTRPREGRAPGLSVA